MTVSEGLGERGMRDTFTQGFEPFLCISAIFSLVLRVFLLSGVSYRDE